MIGLTNLWTNGLPMAATKLNRQRALIIMEKIDEILFWEKTKEQERDVRFVDLGQYLCEVRAGQYWRLENLKSFDEFLEKRFPESRRKAYYLMAIHENLTRRYRNSTLKEMGWRKAAEMVKVARGERESCSTVHPGCTRPRRCPERVQARGGKTSDRQGVRTLGTDLFQGLQGPACSHRAGAGNGRADARK